MARMHLLLFCIFFSISSFAQIREIPEEVKRAFESQYPMAENVEFKDNLLNVHIYFELNGEKMMAIYNNKGAWKNTEKEWSYDKLSQEVKDGFEKSKFAEWNVTETKIIQQPGGTERIRIKAEKNDVSKRYLFFNKSGRLTGDAITL
ncbi:MAG TPA: PepSY-like domain-containing protein [Chitinophagaceae bacterium]|nr:PepSY-like domain-containing protein [Chitinophagaceae bacterium]